MVASALTGTAWSRWVLRVEPLASATRDVIAAWLGSTLDSYATDPEFSTDEPLGASMRPQNADAARSSPDTSTTKRQR